MKWCKYRDTYPKYCNRFLNTIGLVESWIPINVNYGMLSVWNSFAKKNVVSILNNWNCKIIVNSRIGKFHLKRTLDDYQMVSCWKCCCILSAKSLIYPSYPLVQSTMFGYFIKYEQGKVQRIFNVISIPSRPHC